tara:strand:- start:543 stop:752 length:210 start_codon:yes stop_codon:yes gene_type:complete
MMQQRSLPKRSAWIDFVLMAQAGSAAFIKIQGMAIWAALFPTFQPSWLATSFEACIISVWTDNKESVNQ